MMRRLGVVGPGVLAAFMLLPLEALAQTGGAVFVGGDSVSLSVKPGEAARLPISVVNGSSSIQTLTIWATPNAPGVSPLPSVAVVPVESAATPAGGSPIPVTSPGPGPAGARRLRDLPDVPAGDVVALELDAGVVQDSVAFALVLTSSDGSVDQMAVTITLEATHPSVSFEPGTVPISSPFPASIVLSAVWPRIDPDDPHIVIDPTIVSAVSPLYREDGAAVVVSYDEKSGRVTVPNLPEPGKYVGSILDGDGNSASALELHVKHTIWFALLTVIIGLAAGFLVQVWVTGVRPQWAFGLAIDRLRGSAAAANRRELRRLKKMEGRALVDPPVPVQIYDGRRSSWLASQIANARTAVAGAAGEELETTVGTELTTLDDLLEGQRNLWAIGDAVRYSYWYIHGRIPPNDRLRLESGRIPFAIGQAMRGRVVETKDDFEAINKAWTDLLTSLRALGELVDELEHLEHSGVTREKTGPLYERLAELTEVSGEPETKLASDIRKLWEHLEGGVKSAGLRDLNDRIELKQRSLVPQPIVHGALRARQAPARRSIWERVLDAFVRMPRRHLAAQLAARDNVYLLVILFFAILAGLSINYAPKDTFGSRNDYAVLLVWGFAAEVIGELVKRLWGRLGLLAR